MAAGGLLAEAETAWVAYLFESWQSGDWDDLPREDREYGQRHLGAHLDDAAAEDVALYALVSERWMRSWFALENAHDGFLDDVDRAWGRADRGALESVSSGTRAAAAHLALQVRCAVCHGSVVGMSDRVSPELLTAVLRTRLWSGSQALAIVKRAPSSSWKSELWEILVREFPPSLHAALLREVGGLDAAGDRIEALLATLPVLLGEPAQRAASDAVSAALQLEEPGTRGRALRKIVKLVPLRVAERVLDVLEADAHRLQVRDFDREDILGCLAASVPDGMLGRVLRLAEALRPESRSRPLLALLPRAANDKRRAMLAASVEAIGEEPNLATRCKLLASLTGSGAPGLGMALGKAIDEIEHSESQLRLEAIEALGPRHWTGRRAARLMRAALAKGEPFWSIRAVVALFEGLDDAAREDALKGIRAASPEDRCEGLAALAVRTSGPLRDRLWDEALAAMTELLQEVAARRRTLPADATSDDYSCAHRLDLLIEGATADRMPAVAKLIRRLEGAAVRVPRLAALAARGSAQDRERLGAEAVEALSELAPASQRAEVAADVLQHLPDAAAQGAAAIGLAAIDGGDAAYFHRLLPHLAESDAAAALEVAGRLEKPYAVASALVALAERFPKVTARAAGIARTLADAHERARALAGLAQQLADEAAIGLTREAVAASEEIGDAQALAALRDAMSTALSSWPAEGEAESYVDVPTLSVEDAEREIKALDAIRDPNPWLTAVTELLPQLPTELCADPARNAWFYAQDTTGAELDHATAACTMAWLLQFLPDSEQQGGRRDVFDRIQAIHDLRERSWAAIDVARLIPEDKRTELLEPLVGIAPFLAHEDDVADILARAAPRLPASLLPAAADAVFAIEIDALRARALGPLAERAARLAATAPTAAQECWQRLLHGQALRPRPSFLDALPLLMPLAAQVTADSDELAEILAEEIENVSRWWP